MPVCLLAHRAVRLNENHKNIQLGFAPMGQVNTPLLSRFPHDMIDRALPVLVIPVCRGPEFSPSLRVASSPNRILWHYDLP